MSYSSIASGFIVIRRNGQPVLEEARQGHCALVFLNKTDAAEYCEQMCEVHNVCQKDYAIAAMPIYHIQRLLSHAKVRICVVENWEAVSFA